MKLKSNEIPKALEVLSCLNAQVRPATASRLQLLGLALLCSFFMVFAWDISILGFPLVQGIFCCLAELQGRI